MAKRFFSIAGLAVVVLIVLAACGTPQDTGPEATVTRIPNPPNAPVLSPTPDGSTVAATEAPAASTAGDETGAGTEEASGDQQVVKIASHDIYFEPSEITAKAGKVTLDLPNEGAAAHNFSIDELDIHIDMGPGTEQQVEVDLPAGTYQYYCNVPGHKDAGMVGTLTVE